MRHVPRKLLEDTHIWNFDNYLFMIKDNSNGCVRDSAKAFLVISALEEAFSEGWLPVFLEEGAKQMGCHRDWNGKLEHPRTIIPGARVIYCFFFSERGIFNIIFLSPTQQNHQLSVTVYFMGVWK